MKEFFFRNLQTSFAKKKNYFLFLKMGKVKKQQDIVKSRLHKTSQLVKLCNKSENFKDPKRQPADYRLYEEFGVNSDYIPLIHDSKLQCNFAHSSDLFKLFILDGNYMHTHSALYNDLYYQYRLKLVNQYGLQRVQNWHPIATFHMFFNWERRIYDPTIINEFCMKHQFEFLNYISIHERNFPAVNKIFEDVIVKRWKQSEKDKHERKQSYKIYGMNAALTCFTHKIPIYNQHVITKIKSKNIIVCNELEFKFVIDYNDRFFIFYSKTNDEIKIPKTQLIIFKILFLKYNRFYPFFLDVFNFYFKN